MSYLHGNTLAAQRNYSAAASSHDNASPDETASRTAELADELGEALIRDPEFIATAICNADLTDLFAAHAAKDGQAALDALTDIITGHRDALVRNQMNRIDACRPRDDYEAMRFAARDFGVTA